jgi:hypothetical protein
MRKASQQRVVVITNTGTSIGADDTNFADFLGPRRNVPIKIFFVKEFLAYRANKDFGRRSFLPDRRYTTRIPR